MSVALPSYAGEALVSDTLTVRSQLAGMGVFVPPDGARLAPSSGPEITGVAQRVRPEMGLSTPSIAATAARAALASSGLTAAEVELVVVGTTSPDVLWPSTACLVQTEVGLSNVAAFDVYAAEAGALTALVIADRFVRGGSGAALVVGAEANNQLVRIPAVPGRRFGQAAAAAVLTPTNDGTGIVGATLGGPDQHHLGLRQPTSGGLANAVEQCLAESGLALAEVRLTIGDQAAASCTREWAQRVGLDLATLWLDPARYQSCFAAAPLIALRDAVLARPVRRGDAVLLVSCGDGPGWAVVCLKWGEGKLRPQ